jgi:hypothetical protein
MIKVIKKILKIIMWMTISFVLLFLLVFFLIRIPSVQTRITKYAISIITKKTHTRVELNKINITFPKSLVIEGFYMEDTQKDTLLYAGKVKVNIAFNALLNKKIHIKSVSLAGVNLRIGRTATDSLFNFDFFIKAFSDTTRPVKIKSQKPSAWTYRLDKVNMEDIRLRYDDNFEGIIAETDLKSLEFNVNHFDLAKSIYSINNLVIENSAASLVMKKSSISIHAGITLLKLKDASIVLGNNLNVKVKQIEMENNSFKYLITGKTEIDTTFNPENIQFDHITLSATDIYYSSAQTEARIRKFSAVDRNHFTITQFETDFSMDTHSITAKKLLVKTARSSIDADFSIRYYSLASLKDSLESVVLNTEIRNATIMNSDITYFVPELDTVPFFKNAGNVSILSGMISGTLNNLKGNKVALKTGTNTVLKTDFTIRGLPDYKNAQFDFPDLKLATGKKDIELLAGPSLTAKFELPQQVGLKIRFKGQINSFSSKAFITSSFGDGNFTASVDRNENFRGQVNLINFNLGRLLKDTTMFGPVSLTAETQGRGLDLNTIDAKINAEVSNIYLNKYDYRNLKIDGTVSGKEFAGKISLNDENAMLDFDGLVNLNKDKEKYKFLLNVQGIDLQKLNFTKGDMRIALIAKADLEGRNMDNIRGQMGITQIIIAKEGKKYSLDSLLFASINETNKSEFKISSSLIGIHYTGTVSPAALPARLSQFIGNYFPLSAKIPAHNNSQQASFNFDIQLHNHPIISEVLLPQLKEFQPGLIEGSFDQAKNSLVLNAAIGKIVYGTTEINDLEVDVNSDATQLNYKISTSSMSTAKIKFDNFMLAGKMADQTLVADLSSIDDQKHIKLQLSAQITKQESNYRFKLNADNFYLMNEQWGVTADNYIEFGTQGFRIHHFFLNKGESQINIASVHDQLNDDLNIGIKNFRLDDISRIIEKDTSLVKGTISGNVLLKRVNNAYGVIADAKISSLTVREIPIGDLTLKAENPTAARFDVSLNVSGADNNFDISGFYIPKGGGQSISIKGAVKSLSMKTVEAFSMGKISEAAGTLSGNFQIGGNTGAPEITGEMVFNNAFIKPAFTNNRIELKNETIQLTSDGIYFKSFTLSDISQHKAVIDGKIGMKQFSNFTFDLQVTTVDFLLFNTTVKDNKNFKGRMIIDSRIEVKGPLSLPVITAKLKIKKGSNFTFAVPEDKLTTDRGEDVVEFMDTRLLNPILLRKDKNAGQNSRFTGVDLSSVIEIDKEATLKLLMDPASTDSLVVKGEAALSFALDRSGKMTLTGAYNLNDGSYLVSLESVLKRKFQIVPGSTIIWNGDPLDAKISINATYSVRASPYDLVADQMTGLSDTEKGGYKQRYPFLVVLKLRGEILHPEISFEIQLPPEEKGILGGAVNQKLNMLNEDASALNKQVFALLVLGRFVQENPLQTESGGTSTMVRSTVGKFLSAQLNQLSSKIIPGIDLNFDIQSFNDYQTGQAQGRTQVEVGLKKELFNERLSVQVGGKVDVEGEKAKQNSASDITSDVTVEYKLTKDGTYRFKAFRHNQYEGAIEGQLVETGVGILFLRDFNKWKELMIRQKKIARTTQTKKQP